MTQIGNGLYFGDSYNGSRTLAAGALGGVIGGITGALTKVPVPAGEKVVREEVFGEFIDTYANSTASGGGKSIKGSLWGGNKTSSSFINTLDEPLTVSASKNPILLSKSKFGHTFTKHGQNATKFLMNRAKGSGMMQGQFLNDQKAAQFILNNTDKLGNGAINLPIPKGFPARVILPNGSFSPATHIRLVPSGKGVKTAYPFIF